MDSNPRPEQFGVLLKSHRIRRGTTQRQLADLSTVSIRAIRDLELGRSRRPRRDTVRLIADGLGLGSRERARLEAAADDLRLIYGASFAPPPAPLDGLVGRDAEVEVLKKLLRSGGHRLVLVSGVGGVGKTRLTLAVADALMRPDSRCCGTPRTTCPARCGQWLELTLFQRSCRPALATRSPPQGLRLPT
jgi:transcriptional regulator with XRE-family HTH domain